MTLPLGPSAGPPAFVAAVQSLQAVLAARGELRPGLTLREVPAPKRMAPWSVALAAELSRADVEVASGRFVVLHDPNGQDGWGGETRIVALIQAQVEEEMVADPMLPAVGWSWLIEALHLQQVAYAAPGGTVTRTASTRFGTMQGPADTSEIEIRASWTALPRQGELHLDGHLSAWCDLLCTTAGLPPPGVALLHD